MPNFSERMGYRPGDAEITVRHEAPYDLRGVVVNQAYAAGLAPHGLRSIVCRVLQTREDPSNWSAFPNVDGEVRGHLDRCAWYVVYDIIEAIHEDLAQDPNLTYQGKGAEPFAASINRFFRRKGIGWQLVDGRIETRGAEGFEHTLAEAKDELAAAGRATAANEVHQAIADLSRRPAPDVTGAIQHALAALECVARDVAGNPKPTLGQILTLHPTYDDAELVVHVAAAVARHLSRKHQRPAG